jgi:2'-5' RNA ligase
MAFLGIRVPHETARLLTGLDVPGEKTPSDEKHITILYLGKDVPIESVLLAIEAAYEVARTCHPFLVSTSRIGNFPKNPDGMPLIAHIDSPQLHQLRAKLTRAFDEVGAPYDTKYPEYKPHVTLAYCQECEDDVDEMTLDPIQWAVSEMTLWGGDRGDDRLSATFPFTLEAPTRRSVRAAVQTALRTG